MRLNIINHRGVDMNRIKELRMAKGETQDELAKAIGKKYNQIISYYEVGDRAPSLKTWFKLAKHFNVSLDYLTGFVEENSLTPKKIKMTRINLVLTQREFGQLFNPEADKSIVSRWELGKTIPNPERTKIISNLNEGK